MGLPGRAGSKGDRGDRGKFLLFRGVATGSNSNKVFAYSERH